MPDLEFMPEVNAGKFDAKYVKETEQMLGQRLPADFLALLKQHNAGIPKQRFFPLGKNMKVLDQFLGLIPGYADNRYGDLDIGVIWSAIEDRLNEHLVPFALAYPGDYLCFDYENAKVPKVVLWLHDQSNEDSPVTQPVAKNFKAFLSMLIDEAAANSVG